MLITVIAACLSFVLALPAAAQDTGQAVVFDIDGTLTPNVYAIAIARPDAAKAAMLYADAGVEIIYLTARVRLFQDGVHEWLSENGFPAGQLYLTETEADRDDHAAFKHRVLAAYLAQGGTIIAAYGDSSTDFDAYAKAGIPRDHVFALRRSGRSNCKDGIWHGCYDGWESLIPLIASRVADN